MFKRKSYMYIRIQVAILLFFSPFALLFWPLQALSKPKTLLKSVNTTATEPVVFEPKPILPDNYNINYLPREMQADFQIRRLEKRLVELLTTHTELHPDVITLQRKLNALRAKAKQPLKSGKGNLKVNKSTVTAIIRKLETQLESLHATHTDKHPDVIILKRKLDALRKNQESLK